MLGACRLLEGLNSRKNILHPSDDGSFQSDNVRLPGQFQESEPDQPKAGIPSRRFHLDNPQHTQARSITFSHFDFENAKSSKYEVLLGNRLSLFTPSLNG